MNFFSKFFKDKFLPKKQEDQIEIDHDDASIDEKFVKQFIHKGGKFLYCSSVEEAQSNMIHILEENHWNNVVCFEEDLKEFLTKIKSAKTERVLGDLPFFTNCESLIAQDGSIMFSSKQLHEKKLKDLPLNFIVFAKTSQISKDTRDGISGVRNRAEKNSPTIISSVKDYIPNKPETDFMNYGNTNSKTLYLLLLEDL
jgi:L-lactate utilization protein LutC